MKRISKVIALLFLFSAGNFAQKVHLYFNPSPQVDFGVKQLEKSFPRNELQKLIQKDFNNNTEGKCIVLAQLKDEKIVEPLLKEDATKLTDMKQEGFSIIKSSDNNEKTIYVVGFDEPGLMYGTFELAEQIKLKGIDGVSETKQNPYMHERGVKFNIPLDVRTPSYTDASESAQKNIATVWDFNFWKAFIDRLALDRYNLISLWNLNPFPSMVKVPEYPEVALNNVERSDGKWKEYNPTNGRRLSTPEILKHVEVLKKLTIDQKIAFWRKVMKYGKERNVSFYIITWNVFVNGAEGKYGITDNYQNPITTNYIRQSVKQMILTYPNLAGIGLTTGENFITQNSKGDDSVVVTAKGEKTLKANAVQKEDWAFNTYGLGILDALKEEPGRKITFIHRQHETKALDVLEKFKPLMDNPNVNFVFSFKYAQAHTLSSTVQPFCNGFVKEIETRSGTKTFWELRNDDNYYFRWGAPDFVREFIKNIPHKVSQGYFYGSDGWIWGRDFLSKDPKFFGETEIQRQWYSWMLWGRLGYNPNLKDEVFKEMLAKRFPQVPPQKLFSAWQYASMIYPATTGFHWGAMDFQWYIEGCKRRPLKGWNEYGFEDVNSFINQKVHPGTNNETIPEYVEMLKSGSASDKTTPFQSAQKISDYSDKALLIVKGLKAGNNMELHYILNDIKSMAYLGKYYAHKIKGSAYVEMFRKLDKDKKENQNAAIKELTIASTYWKKYMDVSLKSYKNPIWTNRVGVVDWKKIYKWTLKDIDIARQPN